MKAIVKKFNRPGLWLDDVPMPTPGPNEVLIKTIKNAICGTDVHIYKWDEWAQKTVPVPMVVGHEFVGEIAALGSNVQDLTIGTRICGEGHITCGTCLNCKKGAKHLCPNTLGLGYDCPGAFAEYFVLPAENVFILPDSVPSDIAAIFDPFGNAVHTALSLNMTAEDVLITGSGPIGIMACAIAKRAGARHIVITDVNPYRLELAKTMGATHAVNVSEASLKDVRTQIGIKEGFACGMEMSGTQGGMTTLLENLQNGGHIALLGLLPIDCQIDWDLVIFNMLTIKGIYGREIFSTWFKMSNLIDSGLDLSPVITHRLPVDDFEKGFEAMLSGNCGKVILNW